MTFAAINGFRMNYEVSGNPDGPWLTMSHALANNLTLWDHVAEELGKEFRILRYDQRGHGETQAPVGPYGFPDLLGDVLALWDSLGILRSHWIGLSIGGMIGYGLGIHNSDRLLSLIACDSQAIAPPDYAAYFQKRIDKAAAGGMESLITPTLERWFTPETIEREDPVLQKVGAMIRTTTIEGHAGCCEALKTLNYADQLGRIRVPTLIVGGEGDKGAPPSALADVANLISGAHHEVIPAAGHISALENPEAFLDVVRSFLADEAASTPA